MPKCGGFCHYEIWKTGAFCAFISIWAQISKKKALDLYRTFVVLVLFKMLGINTKKKTPAFFHVCFFCRLFVLFLSDFLKWSANMVVKLSLELGALKIMADPSISPLGGEPFHGFAPCRSTVGQPSRGCSGTWHPRGSLPLLQLKISLATKTWSRPP